MAQLVIKGSSTLAPYCERIERTLCRVTSTKLGRHNYRCEKPLPLGKGAQHHGIHGWVGIDRGVWQDDTGGWEGDTLLQAPSRSQWWVPLDMRSDHWKGVPLPLNTILLEVVSYYPSRAPHLLFGRYGPTWVRYIMPLHVRKRGQYVRA